MSVIVPSGHLLPPAAVGLPLPYIVDCNLSQIGKYLFLESVLQIAPDVSEQTNTRLLRRRAAPSGTRDQGPILRTQAAVFKTCHVRERDEGRSRKHKLSCHVHVAFILIVLLLGWHKPFPGFV